MAVGEVLAKDPYENIALQLWTNENPFEILYNGNLYQIRKTGSLFKSWEVSLIKFSRQENEQAILKLSVPALTKPYTQQERDSHLKTQLENKRYRIKQKNTPTIALIKKAIIDEQVKVIKMVPPQRIATKQSVTSENPIQNEASINPFKDEASENQIQGETSINPIQDEVSLNQENSPATLSEQSELVIDGKYLCEVRKIALSSEPKSKAHDFKTKDDNHTGHIVSFNSDGSAFSSKIVNEHSFANSTIQVAPTPLDSIVDKLNSTQDKINDENEEEVKESEEWVVIEEITSQSIDPSNPKMESGETTNLHLFTNYDTLGVKVKELIKYMHYEVPIAETEVPFKYKSLGCIPRNHACPFIRSNLTRENAIQVYLKPYNSIAAEYREGWVTVSRAGLRLYLRTGAEYFPKLHHFEASDIGKNDIRQVTSKCFNPERQVNFTTPYDYRGLSS